MAQKASAVVVSGEPVPRNLAIRFPADASEAMVTAAVEAWNRRFEENFDGVGYFSGVPEIEMFTGEDEKVVCCYAHYLFADNRLWSQVRQSRVLTVDEPVLNSQVAYA